MVRPYNVLLPRAVDVPGASRNCSLRWDVEPSEAQAGAVVARTLAERLDELFTTMHPAGGREYSYAHVARAVEELGAPKVSATYIWQLRTGKRDSPTKRHIEALAAFFDVPPAYLFDDQVAEQIRAQLQLLATLRDRGVRQVATRAAGLSPRGLHAVDEMIKQVRAREGLDASGDLDATGNPPPPG